MPVSSDAARIMSVLSSKKISTLYHFTCIENLVGIAREQALCSKDTLERCGRWPCAVPGGDALSHSLDRYNGNWDRVSLSFTPYTPMAYWKKQAYHLCFLLIQPEVAAWDGVIFTDTNAASGSQNRGTGSDGLNLVDFNAVRSFRPWDKEGWKRPVQAEVLVPDRIALDAISSVVFVSEASLAEGRRLWQQQAPMTLDFKVKRSLFSNPTQPTAALPYSHVIRALLTSAKVTKEDAGSSFAGATVFSRRNEESITLLCQVSALAGAKAEIAWSDGRQAITEFETANKYMHWDERSLRDFEPGTHYVEYRFQNIKWSHLPFEVTE